MEDQDHTPSPTIQALGIVQNAPPNPWKATGDVDGIGWVDARGSTIVEAMEALQAHAAKRTRERGRAEEDA